MDQSEKQELLFRCSRVYSPAAPIDTQDLFAGRTEQIQLAGQAVHTRGQHAIIFGERGVGKTSLANILKSFLGDEKTLVVKLNCHQSDSFYQLWHSALSEIEMLEEYMSSSEGSIRCEGKGESAPPIRWMRNAVPTTCGAPFSRLAGWRTPS
jgi:energy-coupling factor transporter ATP-binding protein EcfA2